MSENQNLLAEQRRALILDEVRRRGGVRVNELTRKLGVSDMTVRRDLDALALGHDSAAALGVEAEAASRRLFLAASLLAAASVASAGLVGFVGLIVPHIARRLVGVRHRAVLVVAAIAGATLVVLADLAARTARVPAELPLGAVTALLGVPFFLTLLRRAR